MYAEVSLNVGRVISQLDLTSAELEQKLRKVFNFITGVGDSPLIPSPLKDTQLHLLLELGALCAEHCLNRLAQECVLAVSTVSISHDPRLLLRREGLICQLSAQDLDETKEAHSHSIVEVRLNAISKITDLLSVAKRIQDSDLIQYMCVLLWNLSLPLLQRKLRQQLLKSFNEAANVLEEINRYYQLVCFRFP